MNEKLCARCNKRPAKKGYGVPCKKEYSQIYRSNHKKNPPKGQLRGNYRRAEKDFDLPKVTMAYLTPKGGIAHECQTEMSFLGTCSTVYGKEDQWKCFRCYETVYLPQEIYPRLRLCPATPRFDRKTSSTVPYRDILHFLGNYVQGAIS